MDYAKPKPEEGCSRCAYGKQRCGESCYCVLYGIIIGYPKKDCRGFADEQVRERQDGD